MQCRPENPAKPDARYDAIHRAVLTGLLSNVGQKTDPHEYTGARNIKFNLFPGSTLFKREPQWLVAAELVETTRLYARTAARVDPAWIERLADHLLKRTYSDPHWNSDTAHVSAYEKVTLYGLVLVPQRTIHYGPIDPIVARTIFIQSALVQGEYASTAPFFRHNAKLVDDIQTLEAKSRSRDVLVSDQARFDFYDARIPAGIFNGPLFEKWRAAIERHNPKLLFMTRRDLMMHAASHITAEHFPDSMLIQNLRLPLEYHLEPGHPADGVTVTIPLPALTQIPTERFEWLVPGLLKEKLTALIKSLPKDLRVNFVPAPDFADLAFQSLKPGDGALTDALAAFLGRQKGISVPREAFDPGSLLDHLHTNFKVVDEAGKTLGMGRNLDTIRKQLGVEVKKTFDTIEHPKYHRERVTKWDFGDLPESVPIKRHGMSLNAFPALADNGEHVSLRLLDSPEAAKISHAAGLRKLLTTELKDEIRYLGTMIPNLHEMCMHYATLGPANQLRDEIVAKTINTAFLYDSHVRTAMEYELRKEAGRRHRLLEVGKTVAALAGQILSEYQKVALLLSRPAIPAWTPTLTDIRTQIANLLFKGFLAAVPEIWLQHYPRYLKGIAARLQKLPTAGHTRDQQHMAEFMPLWQAYVDRAKKNRDQRILDPNLDTYRWMLEELRISLFAQELRTAVPVSIKRMEKQWELVRK